MYNDMGDEIYNKEEKVQNYLNNRFYSCKNEKDQDFKKVFGLVDDQKPTTAKDLIDRLTSGKYIVNPDKMEKEDYEPLRFFRWRDPAVKEDLAGYKTAYGAMNKAATEVQDAIIVGTPADALTAIKTFETATFH